MALTFPGLSQILSGLNNAPGISKRQTREAEAQQALQEIMHRQGVHRDVHQLDRDRFEWEKQQRGRQNNNPALRMIQQQQAEAARLANLRAQMENKMLGQQTMRQLGPGMSANQGREMAGGTAPAVARSAPPMPRPSANAATRQPIQGNIVGGGYGGMAAKNRLQPIDPMAQLNERMAREQAAQMGLQTQQMRRAMQPQRPMGGRPAAARSSGGGAQPSAQPGGSGLASVSQGLGRAPAGGGGRPGFPGGPVQQGPIGSRTVGGHDASQTNRYNQALTDMQAMRGMGGQPSGDPSQARSLSRDAAEDQLRRNRAGLTGQQSPSGPPRRSGGSITVHSSRPGAGRGR